MIKAVYPGTFDPLTRGHEDLVRRASRLFDNLILAIADSRTKRPFFTLSERIEMSREVLGDVKNLTITGFTGLLTDFVQSQKARVVLQHMFISATLVREIATLGGDVSKFVHPLVRERLAAKVKTLG
jgi:pantetheine-phosphate adenylyltransferase